MAQDLLNALTLGLDLPAVRPRHERGLGHDRHPQLRPRRRSSCSRRSPPTVIVRAGAAADAGDDRRSARSVGAVLSVAGPGAGLRADPAPGHRLRTRPSCRSSSAASGSRASRWRSRSTSPRACRSATRPATLPGHHLRPGLRAGSSNVQLVILVAALRPGRRDRLVAARRPRRAGAAGDRRRPGGRLDDGRRPAPAGLRHDGRRRRRWPAWPACCSPSTSARSPRRPVTRSCSRRSPRSSSAGSAASPASSSGAFVLAGIETARPRRRPRAAGRRAIAFGLIFLMLLFRPRGLLGRQEVRRT